MQIAGSPGCWAPYPLHRRASSAARVTERPGRTRCRRARPMSAIAVELLLFSACVMHARLVIILRLWRRELTGSCSRINSTLARGRDQFVISNARTRAAPLLLGLFCGICSAAALLSGYLCMCNNSVPAHRCPSVLFHSTIIPLPCFAVRRHAYPPALLERSQTLTLAGKGSPA